MEDCRVKVVDQWTGFCPACERSTSLVLLERGPRWTVRELFGRTWRPRQDFAVQCRTCRAAVPVPHEELAAAARHKAPAPARPAVAPARPAVPVPAARVSGPRPATRGVPAQRSARDAAPPSKAGAAH